MRGRSLAALVVSIALATPASAAKWEGGCPPVRQRLQRLGKGLNDPAGALRGPNPYGISKFFEHVGHELTFYLRDRDVERLGGFSTEPDGNTLEVTFEPVGGTPIALPPIPFTATTPYALTVVVPDSRPFLGRLVVGPATLKVYVGPRPLFEARRQIILPPMNNVHDYAIDGYEVDALAAMDRKANVWIPLDFREFGSEGSPLPECPTILTPVTAFAVEFELKKGDEQALPYVSFGNLQKNMLFLGDYLLFGLNMYGNRLKTNLDVSPLANKGILLCGKNDALQLVVKIGLRNPALGDKSELLPLVSDGSPVVVKIHNVSLDPDVAAVLDRAKQDSLYEPCN